MSSTRVEMMWEKKKLGVVGWTRYKQTKSRYSCSPICFVEGDEDIHYYYQRVGAYCDNLPPQFITCGGKQDVINAMNEVVEESDDNKTFAFVDKDFDPPNSNYLIYETPCYSIENLYVTPEVFRETCKHSLNIKEENNSQILDKCIKIYKDRLNEFFEAISELNAWIAYHVSEKNKLNLKDVNLFNEYIGVSLEKVEKLYTLDDLFERFNFEKGAFDHNNFHEIHTKISKDPMNNYRGKFNTLFFREFTKLLSEELRKNDNIFGKKIKTTFNLSKNIVKDLQQYAKTPASLTDYVSKMWKREIDFITES